MYNESVKQQFIEFIGNKGKHQIRSLFNRIGEITECKVDKEIAEMSKDEIIHGFERMNYLSYSSARTDISILRRYLYWYNNNVHHIDLTEIDSIVARDIDISKSIRNNIIESESKLKDVLELAPAKEGYFESPVLLLSWYGLTLGEIMTLKNSDVVFKDKYALVSTPRKTFRLESDYVVTSLKEYKSVKSSIRSHRGDWEVYPDDLGKFIKNMVTMGSRYAGKPLKADGVRKKIEVFSRLFPEGYKRVTIDNVLLSGRLHRILEYEKKYGEIPNDIFINELKIKLPRINDGIALYECYKKAFGIEIENKAE